MVPQTHGLIPSAAFSFRSTRADREYRPQARPSRPLRSQCPSLAVMGRWCTLRRLWGWSQGLHGVSQGTVESCPACRIENQPRKKCRRRSPTSGGSTGSGSWDRQNKGSFHPKTLAQARQFAQAFRGSRLGLHGRPATQHRCRLCRRHLVRLASARPEKRRDLLAKAIRGHWNVSRLEAELWRLYGRRTKGTPPHPPEDRIGLAYYLLPSANWWIRLKGVGMQLNLPPRTKRRLEEVWTAMAALRASLETMLPAAPRGK